MYLCLFSSFWLHEFWMIHIYFPNRIYSYHWLLWEATVSCYLVAAGIVCANGMKSHTNTTQFVRKLDVFHSLRPAALLRCDNIVAEFTGSFIFSHLKGNEQNARSFWCYQPNVKVRSPGALGQGNSLHNVGPPMPSGINRSVSRTDQQPRRPNKSEQRVPLHLASLFKNYLQECKKVSHCRSGHGRAANQQLTTVLRAFNFLLSVQSSEPKRQFFCFVPLWKYVQCSDCVFGSSERYFFFFFLSRFCSLYWTCFSR